MNIELTTFEKKLDYIYNQFTNEKIGNNTVKMMPSICDKPLIQSINYDKEKDVFELVFKYSDPTNIVAKQHDKVTFIENNTGDLLAIQISLFSKMEITNIKLTITTSIENKIQELTMELKNKKNISNNITEKRKLQFINELVKNNYKDLTKKSFNLTTTST